MVASGMIDLFCITFWHNKFTLIQSCFSRPKQLFIFAQRQIGLCWKIKTYRQPSIGKYFRPKFASSDAVQSRQYPSTSAPSPPPAQNHHPAKDRGLQINLPLNQPISNPSHTSTIFLSGVNGYLASGPGKVKFMNVRPIYQRKRHDRVDEAG
jgi:hypothetical protein